MAHRLSSQFRSRGEFSYNEKVDIYSAACLVWYMVMGKRPLGDLPVETMMSGVTRGLRPDLFAVCTTQHHATPHPWIQNQKAMPPRKASLLPLALPDHPCVDPPLESAHNLPHYRRLSERSGGMSPSSFRRAGLETRQCARVPSEWSRGSRR